MYFVKFYTFFFSVVAFSTLLAQSSNSDSLNKKNEKVVKGFNYGVLPALAFDSDLGLQYGVVGSLYNYGDGSRYPAYNHSLYFEWTHSTKNNNKYQVVYDSEKLLPKLRINAELAWYSDPLFEFYGYNGYNAFYNPEFLDKSNSQYISRVFYNLDRKYSRYRLDLFGNITDRKLRWMAGFTLFDVKTNTVNIEKLNTGKSDADKLLPTTLLYDNYVNWGLISNEQKNGGVSNQLKCGIVYDTRDNEPNPMTGLWSEALLVAAPAFVGNKYIYSKLALTHRQYFTLKKDVLNFCYRVSYQKKLTGNIPFYMLSFVYNTDAIFEGLGGAKTLRGIKRNRVIGDDVLLGNLELRWKFLHYTLFNQNYYCAFATFADFGVVTQKYNQSTSNANAQLWLSQGTAENVHKSAGAGLYVAMNQNFVVALNYGQAFNKNDGTKGIYIGLDFLF